MKEWTVTFVVKAPDRAIAERIANSLIPGGIASVAERACCNRARGEGRSYCNQEKGCGRAIK